MHRRTVVVLVLLLTLGACAGDDSSAPEPSPSPSFPFASVLLDNGEGSTLLTVEVAETPEQQERGLSERPTLPDDEGMVFVFFEARESGFSMGRTTIPLSIAFFDERGSIVRILDLDPCADPCTVTAPEASYMGALAVNRGSFDAWDISEGDHVQLTR